MEKETTKEAAERMSTRVMEILFKDEKKWQQERSYSEEEVIEILNKSCDYIYASSKIGTDKKLMPNLLRGWFEQFKK